MPVSASGDLPRLEQIIDASGVAERIEAMLPVGVRPRQLTVRTLLLGILACLTDCRPAHLRRVHQALLALSDREKRHLGVLTRWKSGEHELTYRQVERTYALIVKALCKERLDGQPSQTLSAVMDCLLEASVQTLGVPESSALSIDWTDYESFARPPRKKGAQASSGQAQAPQSAAEPPCQAEAQSTVQQAERQEGEDEDEDEDERARCADPEGAWGHRKANHPGHNEMFFGYYLQAATIVGEDGGPDVPELTRRITLASCEHDPPAQIVPVIRRMASESIEIGDLLTDSGYSYRAPETFAAPARALGAELVMDLHPNDRGCKGTHQGAILANGNLYCPATPKALLELSPPAPSASAEKLAAHDARCQELSRYKLSPLSAPDPDGYHRAICPAAAGKIRCPHKPVSMSLSHERPSILSPPESAPVCCTQQTITVPASVNAKTAQKHDYPSQAHRASYARRTASERSFSQVKDPAATDTKRGWCRLMGLTPNALFLTCAYITANIRTADAFAARKAEDQRRAACGLPPRKRARRRRTIHDLIAADANAPPA
jgi:hypothetical protein